MIGATLLDTPDMAGAMSFLPKLSRLLDTLLMFNGGAFATEPDLERQQNKSKTIQLDFYINKVPNHLLHLVMLKMFNCGDEVTELMTNEILKVEFGN